MKLVKGFTMRKCFITTCLFLATFIVAGCVNVAVTGAQTVYNRHSISKSISDQYATLQAYQKIMKDSHLNNTNIEISTYNNEMLIAGQVPYPSQRAKVDKIAREIPEVKRIYNLVQIANPSSSLTRLSDTWITAKIKSKLIASNDVDGSNIKVVTENGTVYLMGILPPEQAKAAVDIASDTAGVESVVKIFSYVRISKQA